MSYPIMLAIEGKKAVVVGGGRVAFRKVRNLVDAKAEVTVISPELTGELQGLMSEGEMTWINREFQEGDLEGAMVVIAATDQPEINQRVLEDATDHQLVNVVDDPKSGNFQVPASLKRGRLTIAVSTDGASPFLAKKIRDDIGEPYPESFDHYLEFLEDCREQVKQTELSPMFRKKILQQLVDPEFYDKDKQKAVLNNFQAFLEGFL